MSLKLQEKVLGRKPSEGGSIPSSVGEEGHTVCSKKERLDETAQFAVLAGVVEFCFDNY